MQGVILNPSGNVTGLVLTEYIPENKQEIGKNIMQKFPSVEQVGFLSCEKRNLVMAGGEFCANAARAAVWQLLAGKQGNTSLTVSGYAGTIYGSLSSHGNVTIELKMDFYRGFSIDKNMIGLVQLQGIIHLIVPIDSPSAIDENSLKNLAKEYLRTFDLFGYAAAGIMFVCANNSIISLYPIVRVRDMQTLIFESSCGSGTIAYALYNYKRSKTFVTQVKQPSGSVLQTTLSTDSIQLSGEVSFVQII